jgi:tetratricopeptide (TPR) repeat protein
MGALCGLGDVYRSLEQPDQAIEYYQQALATARKIGANRQAADALSGLAQAHAALGQVASAIDSAEQALETLEAINHPQAPQMKALLAQLRTQAAG